MWPVMHAIDGFDRELLEQAVSHHHAAAALILLGRLEDEMDRPGEIARLRQIAGGTEQHGGMAVMTAGMHLALVDRLVREAVLLMDMERVHIGAKRDGPTARGCALERAHHARAGEPAMDRDPEAFQLGSDEIGGPVFLERRLRMGMKIAAPARHIGMEISNTIDDRHGMTALSCV